MKKAKPFYYSSAWRKCRETILTRDKYLCQPCLRKGMVTRATIVHHIKPLADYPELAFDADNLESCCHECHEKHHPEHGFTQLKRQIIVILGYPGPEKTRWAKQMMQEHDALLAPELIARTIGSEEIAQDIVKDVIRNIRGKNYSFNTLYIIKDYLSEEEEQLLRAARARFYWMDTPKQGDTEATERWKAGTKVRLTRIPPLPKA